MENIYVESNKSYYQGFVLKEQDLRRIIDLMHEQFKKINNNSPVFNYTIKFKNGAVANTDDIETVLKLENEGSAAIIRLDINGIQVDDTKESSISISFKNVDEGNESSENAIKHIIKGQTRDWVFVTSSLVEERINKIKRVSINQLTNRGTGKLLLGLAFPIMFIILMIVMFASIPDASEEINRKRAVIINDIEKEWSSHKLTDPVKAIIKIEKSRLASDTISPGTIMSGLFLSKPVIILVSSLIIIMLLIYIYNKFYPAYNFYWGSYMEIFNKKESSRKLLVGLIVGTVILGVIVNLLSNLIWEKI